MFEVGQQVKVAPVAGTIVEVQTHRSGRTKKTAEEKRWYVVELASGAKIRCAEAHLVEVEESTE